MPDNRHPVRIVYANGVRIPVDYEAAFTCVLVVDKMNSISSFVLDFEAPTLECCERTSIEGQLDLSFFGFQDKISILLGYYGDLRLPAF